MLEKPVDFTHNEVTSAVLILIFSSFTGFDSEFCKFPRIIVVLPQISPLISITGIQLYNALVTGQTATIVQVHYIGKLLPEAF